MIAVGLAGGLLSGLFAIGGGIIAGAAVTLVVFVLRSLLRQAASMRLELDEVV